MSSRNDRRAEDDGVQGQTPTVYQYGDENSSVPLADASQDGDIDLSQKVAAALDAAGVPVDESQADEEDTDIDVEAPVMPPEDHGSVSGGVLRFLFGGGEPRHEEGEPQDKRGPTEETPAAASEVSSPAAKSDSDSRDNDTLTSMLFGPSSKDKVANEAAAESTSEQSEQDKDNENDKNDGGFAVAEKLSLIPSEEKEDETAAAAADVDAGPTEETPAAASEDSTPAAKSDSDSSDSESTSEQSEQDKDSDNDENDGGFAVRIAEKLGLMPLEEKEDETAAAAAADADADAGPTEETLAANSEVSTPVAKSGSDVTSPLKESSAGLSRDNDTLTSILFGPSPGGKAANEAAAECTSKQSEQDKDNGSDKNDGGFFEMIAEKLDLIPSDDEEDKTAAPAADADAGPTEETLAAASEVSTPVAKSGSDVTSPLKEPSAGSSRDNDTLTSMLFGTSPEDKVVNEAATESPSKQSEQDKDKDNDKNDGGFFEMIAEKLDLIPSDEKDKTAAAADADADAAQSEQDKDDDNDKNDGGFFEMIAEKLDLIPSDEKDKTAAAAADADAGPTEETPAAASEVSTSVAKSGSNVTSPLNESSTGLSRDNDTLTSMLFGPSSKGKVANEAAAESTSKQSEQDKDSDKNDGGFFEMIAEKLDLIPSDEED